MKLLRFLLSLCFLLTACASQMNVTPNIIPSKTKEPSKTSVIPTKIPQLTITEAAPEVVKLTPFPEEAWKSLELGGYENEFSNMYAVGENTGEPYPVEFPHCIYKIGDVKKVIIQAGDLTIIRVYECHYKDRDKVERVIYLPLAMRKTKTGEWYDWRSNVSNLDVDDGYLDALIISIETDAKERYPNGYGVLQFNFINFNTSWLLPTTIEFLQSAVIDQATISDDFKYNGNPAEFPDLKGTNSKGEIIIFKDFVIPAQITWQ